MWVCCEPPTVFSTTYSVPRTRSWVKDDASKSTPGLMMSTIAIGWKRQSLIWKYHTSRRLGFLFKRWKLRFQCYDMISPRLDSPL